MISLGRMFHKCVTGTVDRSALATTHRLQGELSLMRTVRSHWRG